MSAPEPGERPAPSGAPAWSAVKAVLGEALDLAGNERAAYLEKACAGDAALRARVEEMLAAYSGDDRTLNPDAGRIAVALKEELTTGALDAVGKKIGRYTVERLIGRGGMGAVYEARDQTLGRQVALKVVGAAFAAPDVLRRFAHESKVLARLQHPGIAQVYESEIHHEPGFDRPTPYFAMELVDGATPINAYCRDGAVGLPRTLELLASVCDAVHHGHQRGVIHRDLKPGNILVDSRGAAKVIDFGVARVMDSDVAATARTREGQIVGTLNYMSPEQCRADSDAIDIRADVYSLGVVLYECLTGSTPYEAGGQSGNTPAGSNLVAMLRAIEHDAPVRPSRRVHALRGDIETVVLKALEKSPERRYQSAADLGAELRRVLAHQPIAAHPPSAAYELTMFVRRNRTLVAATTLVFLALVGGVIGTTAGLARAKQAQARAQLEAQRATRIASFFKKAFRSADPALLPPSVYATLSPDLYAMELATSPDGQWGRAQQAGEQTTVKDVLRFAAEHLGQEFADDPVLESELRLSVGEILNSLNDIVGGVPQAMQGLEGLAAELSDDDPRVIRARWLLGHGFLTNPSPDRALPLLEKSLEGSRRVYGPLAPFTVLVRRDIALAYAFQKGRTEESLRAEKTLIDEVAAANGADSVAAWVERAALTTLLRVAGRTEEAVTSGREAVAALDRVAGKDAGPTIRARRDLYASLALNPADADEAFEVISTSLDSAERFYGSDHPMTADIRGYKLLHALRRRDLASAEALARRSLDFGRRVYGPESDSIGRAEGTLARILIWRGTNAAEALSLAEHSIVIAREKLKVPPEEDFLCYYGAIRAGALRLLGRTDEAMAELNARMADRREVQSRGGVAWVEIMLYAELSASQLALGKTEPARAWLDKAEAAARSMRDQTFPSVLYVRDIRAAFDKATGRDSSPP